MTQKVRTSSIIGGVLFASVFGTLGLVHNVLRHQADRERTEISRIEEGYALPSKVRIRTQDSNRNGKEETILEYEGVRYRLYIDEIGRPDVQPYQAKR
jgi:hypothetical protein